MNLTSQTVLSGAAIVGILLSCFVLFSLPNWIPGNTSSQRSWRTLMVLLFMGLLTVCAAVLGSSLGGLQ